MLRGWPLLVLLFVSTVHALEQNEAFFNFKELAKPASQTGNRASQDFVHHTEHGAVKLKYDVEFREGVHFLHLDDEPSVVQVVCDQVPQAQNGSVFVSFSDLARVQSLLDTQQPVLISGSHRWKCLDEKGGHTNLMFEATAPPKLLDSTKGDDNKQVLRVQIPVTKAGFQHFFKHAMVHFSTAVYPDGWFTAHSNGYDNATTEPLEFTHERKLRAFPTAEAPSPHATAHRERVGGWFSALTSAWNTIKTIGQTVTKIVAPLVEVAKVLVTGDYSYSNTFMKKTWTWNFDYNQQAIINTKIPIDASVTCDSCAADATFEIVFSLDIKGGALKNVKFIGQGKMNLDVGAVLALSSAYAKEWDKLLTTIKMSPIAFSIGIPVVINTNIPITLGYDVDFSAKGNIDVELSAFGDFAYGIQYTPSLGFKRISYSDYGHQGNIYAAAMVSLNAQVYVLATVEMQINYIGGPNVGVKAYAEVVVDMTTAYPRPCAGLAALAVNLGMQVTIGGAIDIGFSGLSIYKKTFDPVGIWSVKLPILTGCFGSSSVAIETRRLEADAQKAGLAPVWPPSTTRRLARNIYRFRHDSNSTTVSKNNPRLHPAPLLLFGPSGDFVGYGAVNQLACAEGVTWVGNMARGSGTSSQCSQYPAYRTLSFQTYATTITAGGPIMDMIGSINDISTASLYSCVKQQTVSASIYQSGDLLFQIGSEPSLAYDLCTDSSSSCTCSAAATTLPQSFYGKTDGELSYITFEDSLRCTTSTLTRVIPATSGAYYRGLARDFNKSTPSAVGCGMTPSGPTPAPPGSCCGGKPASQCNQPRGASCDFGCQCLSGACGPFPNPTCE